MNEAVSKFKVVTVWIMNGLKGWDFYFLLNRMGVSEKYNKNFKYFNLQRLKELTKNSFKFKNKVRRYHQYQGGHLL